MAQTEQTSYDLTPAEDSQDDSLEDTRLSRDDSNDTLLEQPSLPEDNDRPAAAADQPASQFDDTHPATDSARDIDSHELYDEGLDNATEAARRSELNQQADNDLLTYDSDH